MSLATLTLFVLAAPVQVTELPFREPRCHKAAALEPLGGGTQGSRGILRLEVEGAPIDGLPFRFRVVGGSPGDSGLFFTSPQELPLELPEFNASVFPGIPTTFYPFAFDSSGSSPWWDVRGFCGSELLGQALSYDPHAVGGIAFSRAFRARFGGAHLTPPLSASYQLWPEFADTVVLGDYDGDGRLDLAAWWDDQQTGLAASLRDSSSLGFAPPQVTAGPPDVGDLQAMDLNLDGLQDVLMREFSGGLRTYMSLGDGTFGSVQAPPLWGDFVDLDQDGVPDVFDFDSLSQSIRVAYGLGDGTFQAIPTAYPVGVSATDAQAADWDGDGHVDLALALGGNSIAYVPGLGSRLFGSPLLSAVELPIQGLIEGADFDQDGLPDLLIGSPEGLAVLGSLGDGTFSLLADATPVFGAEDFALRDLNGDGVPDYVVAVFLHSRIQVYRGNVDGTFSFLQEIDYSGQRAGVAVADVTEDGLPDLVVGTRGNVLSRQRMVVAPGLGDGTFAMAEEFPIASTPEFLTIADVNGDQRSDVVATEFSRVFTVLADEQGGFGSPVTKLVGCPCRDVVAADWNRDGFDDLVVPCDSELRLLASLGNGLFGDPVVLALPHLPNQLEVVEVNGDDIMDLAISSPSDQLIVMAGNGGPTGFDLLLALPLGMDSEGVSSGHLNNDAVLDFVVSGSDGLLVLIGGPGPSWSHHATLQADGPATIGDFNEDGFPDIVAEESLSAHLFLGLGNGSFATGIDLQFGGDHYVAADFDRDGHLDIAEATFLSNRVALGRGDGTFEPLLSFMLPDSGTADMVAVDLDGDWMPELVQTNSARGMVVIQRNLRLR